MNDPLADARRHYQHASTDRHFPADQSTHVALLRSIAASLIAIAERLGDPDVDPDDRTYTPAAPAPVTPLRPVPIGDVTGGPRRRFPTN